MKRRSARIPRPRIQTKIDLTIEEISDDSDSDPIFGPKKVSSSQSMSPPPTVACAGWYPQQQANWATRLSHPDFFATREEDSLPHPYDPIDVPPFCILLVLFIAWRITRVF